MHPIPKSEMPKYEGKRLLKARFPLYLRLLDAHMTNHGIAATAKGLAAEKDAAWKEKRAVDGTEENHKQTIKEALKTALRLRDDDYRLISMWKR